MSLYAVVNPATGETVKEYPTISDDDLRDAIGRADQAMRDWSAQSSIEDRAALVRRVGELHAEQRERLAEIIVREMGKPVEQALAELDFTAAIYEYYADNAPKLLANEQIEWVIGDPRVRGVSLTGSERAGAAVAEIAGRNLKKVVLELGGSDPFILLSTDDLDAAVENAVAARVDNTGQSCNAAKRFIVTDELYEPFLEKFTSAITSWKTGDPTAE